MYAVIICILAYIALMKWNKRYELKYMQIHNMTNEEYDNMMKEKMKNYNPYEHSEIHLA
tara:strand:+ start:559 stop:735 length:177 start_codon:yes stop_codon:yes gene_type:complete